MNQQNRAARIESLEVMKSSYALLREKMSAPECEAFDAILKIMEKLNYEDSPKCFALDCVLSVAMILPAVHTAVVTATGLGAHNLLADLIALERTIQVTLNKQIIPPSTTVH